MTEKDIKEAIIYSAMHVGYWDDSLTEKLMNDETKILSLNIPKLIEALKERQND